METLIRNAETHDLDRLVELDLMMFENAYGTDIPDQSSVYEMLERRLGNISVLGGGKMLVCEVDGEVNGFGSYFRTDKPWEEFTTWEDSTNDGTLEGVVKPYAPYAYVPNMTVAPKASADRGMQKIMVNLVASAIEENVDYAYFVSRIPQFTSWLGKQGISHPELTEEELDRLAQTYVDLEEESKRGKLEPVDYELRTYVRSGFNKGKLVKGGFSDQESLCYGVTFRVDLPLTDKPIVIRRTAAKLLRLSSRSTKLMSKI